MPNNQQLILLGAGDETLNVAGNFCMIFELQVYLIVFIILHLQGANTRHFRPLNVMTFCTCIPTVVFFVSIAQGFYVPVDMFGGMVKV
jgi:hypothetical protein